MSSRILLRFRQGCRQLPSVFRIGHVSCSLGLFSVLMILPRIFLLLCGISLSSASVISRFVAALLQAEIGVVSVCRHNVLSLA
ncbi:MAG: hypothetical protein MHM6MM_009685 [Cercozoa sp. M6MM]